MTSHAQSRGHCRVLSGEKWLGEAGGATAVCSEVEHVDTSIAVKVARRGNLPGCARVYLERAGIVGETAIRLPKPVACQAAIVAPQNITAPVAVEIVGCYMIVTPFY